MSAVAAMTLRRVRDSLAPRLGMRFMRVRSSRHLSPTDDDGVGAKGGGVCAGCLAGPGGSGRPAVWSRIRCRIPARPCRAPAAKGASITWNRSHRNHRETPLKLSLPYAGKDPAYAANLPTRSRPVLPMLWAVRRKTACSVWRRHTRHVEVKRQFIVGRRAARGSRNPRLVHPTHPFHRAHLPASAIRPPPTHWRRPNTTLNPVDH